MQRTREQAEERERMSARVGGGGVHQKRHMTDRKLKMEERHKPGGYKERRV